MAALTDTPTAVKFPQVELMQAAVSTVIYQGSLLGLVAGTKLVRPLVAGDQFAGIADGPGLPSTSPTLKGYNVIVQGAAELLFPAAALTDINKPVYASDSNTYTFTATGNSYIGHVRNVIVGKALIVELPRTKAIINTLTTTVGTVSDTIADATASFVQATTNNNNRSMAEKINEVIKLLRGY